MVSYLKSTISFLKKVFLVIAVYLIVISLFSYFINKDKISLAPKTDPIKKNRAEIYKVINDKELNKTKEGKLTIMLYKMSMCSMIGEACTNNPADADKNYGKSVFGFMSNLIIIPYANPPASGVMWAYEGLQNAGFVPKTLAAEGIGFAAIKPFSNLWKIFRDLSYMLLVIVLIAIGFMIMFRAKINPQTVISVENALPKIVIALILITFSFAIAGFLIDLTYVLIALIISALSNNNTYYDAGKYTNKYLTAAPWEILIALYPNAGITNIGNALISLTGTTLQMSLRGIVSAISGFWLFPKGIPLITEGIDNIINSILQQLIAGVNINLTGAVVFPAVKWGLIMPLGFFLGFFWMPQVIVGVLVLFTIVFLFFRIFFTLFTSYLKIFLYIIFSPIILVFEAVPTGKSVFSWWFKSLFAELLYFPVLIALLLVGNIIQSIAASGAQMWQPPFLGQIDPNTYSILIGMMLLLLIPDLMKLMRELLGVKDLPIPVGIGTFFGGAGAAVGGGMGLVGQFGSLSLGLTAIAPMLGLKGQNLAEYAKDFVGRVREARNPAGGGKADPEKLPGAET